MLSRPTFSIEQVHQHVCRSWCNDLSVEQLGDAYAIRLPVAWPTGELARCYLQSDSDGQLVVSDWGGIRAELFSHGIHRSALVDQFAISLGFASSPHGELVRLVRDPEEELARTVMNFTEIASAALADLTTGEFHAPAMLLRPAWENILRTRAANHDGVFIDVSGKHYQVDPQGVFNRTLVAVYQGRPVVASPIVGSRKPNFAELFYLLKSGTESIRGILPVVRLNRPDAFERELAELAEVARSNNKVFAHVPVLRSGERFEQRSQSYPAVSSLEQGGSVFEEVLEQSLRAA